jgi:threonine dehydratase
MRRVPRQVPTGIRLMCRHRLVAAAIDRKRRAEGAGALSVAAALTGRAGQGPIVAIVSGGNVDLKKFCEIIDSSVS